MSPWETAREYGYAMLDRREVKSRAHHVCRHCGRPIERNEYATRVVTIEGGTVRAVYSCCEKSWD